MAAEREKSWLERWFWPVLAIGVVVVVVVVVLGFRAITSSNDDLRKQLNANYVETIGLTSESAGGRTQQILVIDGVTRRDCTEKKAIITCTKDPQPTPERSRR